jgi:hypothetical protein
MGKLLSVHGFGGTSVKLMIARGSWPLIMPLTLYAYSIIWSKYKHILHLKNINLLKA